jgi:hypothetical protein
MSWIGKHRIGQRGMLIPFYHTGWAMTQLTWASASPIRPLKIG